MSGQRRRDTWSELGDLASQALGGTTLGVGVAPTLDILARERRTVSETSTGGGDVWEETQTLSASADDAPTFSFAIPAGGLRLVQIQAEVTASGITGGAAQVSAAGPPNATSPTVPLYGGAQTIPLQVWSVSSPLDVLVSVSDYTGTGAFDYSVKVSVVGVG